MFGTEHPLILMETHITQIEKVKTRHHLFGCLARTKILMVLISMQKFML